MKDITLEELLAAGCHFGHQVNRRNPKAAEFIYEARAGVNIIDLGKTREGLLKAAEFVKNLASNGGNIIVVGTKRQASPIVEQEVERARKAGALNIYYTTSRWIGGILTNFSEVSKNFKKLEDIEKIITSDSSDYTKREKLLFERERQKLLTLYRGILGLKGTPDAMFVVDTHLESTAVREGRKMNVTLVGITDTNSDPSVIDYPIPANDDATGSIQLIVSYIVDAFIEGAKKGLESKSDAGDGKKKESKSRSGKESSEEKPKKTATKSKNQESEINKEKKDEKSGKSKKEEKLNS